MLANQIFMLPTEYYFLLWCAWSKVMVGTGNNSDILEIGQAQAKFKKLSLNKSLSQASLEKLISDGCSFKVIEEVFESSGAYKKMGFECSFVNVANTPGLPYLFSCSPSQEEGHFSLFTKN